MKTVETEAGSWDDLIFENRNHAYGAYAVRKAYPSNVNRAAAITFGLAAAMASISFIKGDNLLTHPLPDCEMPTLKLKTEVTIIPDAPREQPVQVQRTRGSLPPVATARPVEEVLPTDEVVPFQSGTETGTDDPVMALATTGTSTAGTIEVPLPVEDKIWDHTEVAASYKGGLEAMVRFMSKNVKYPSIARRREVQGTVYVSFVVGKAGEILEARVVKGIDAACDAEALRVINLMKEWSPGLQGGVPVKVRMVLPITFRLAN